MKIFNRYDSALPAFTELVVFFSPYSWGIFILSILSGIILLFLKVRSRSIFLAYTTFFVLVVTMWTFCVLTVLYLLFFQWGIEDISRWMDRHTLIEHQRPSPVTLVIDEQSAWKASGRIFDFAIRRMSRLMREERPDIAQKFHNSASEALGWPELDLRDFSLAEKEYVLIILTTFRQELAEEKKIEFDKYTFPCCESPMALFYEVSEKRLAEFGDLLQRSIDRLRGCSLDISAPEAIESYAEQK